MRIESQAIRRVSRADLAPEVEKARRGTTAAGEDGLQLSPTGRLVMVARQALGQAPPVRSERVQQVGQRLAAGRYRCNDDAIAEAMLGEGDRG